MGFRKFSPSPAPPPTVAGDGERGTHVPFQTRRVAERRIRRIVDDGFARSGRGRAALRSAEPPRPRPGAQPLRGTGVAGHRGPIEALTDHRAARRAWRFGRYTEMQTHPTAGALAAGDTPPAAEKAVVTGSGEGQHERNNRKRPMPEIILHHYDLSPYSEKVRLALGLKGLSWRSVITPIWMPKPDLVPLTGGYRRAPVMQVGADVYCDSQLILRVLERMHPTPSLFPGGSEGLVTALSWWRDASSFVQAVRVLGAMIGDKMPAELIEDRKTAFGFDMGRAAMAPGLPLYVQQLRAHFAWLAQIVSDGRPFVLGAEPSAADLSAYHAIWLLRRNIGADVDALVPFAALQGWYDRVGAIGHGSPSGMAAAEALDVAAGAEPAPPGLPGDGDRFLKPGQRVGVTPDDTGRDTIVGTLVAADDWEIVLRRSDPRVGDVQVHFPRAGYNAAAV